MQNGLKQSLAINLNHRSLLGMVDEIQQQETRLERENNTKTRARRAAQNFGYVDAPAAKVRRVEKDGGKTVPLPAVLHPNLKGFVYVPSDVWDNLASDDQTFIRSYNKAVRHSTALPDTPAGTKLGPPQDDGKGNKDLALSRRRNQRFQRCRRRLPQQLKPVDAPLPPPPNDTMQQPPPSPPPRRVLFNLDDVPMDDVLSPVPPGLPPAIRRLRFCHYNSSTSDIASV